MWFCWRQRRFEQEVIMVLTALSDSVTALESSVAALTVKVDAAIAAGTGGATTAEQQSLADRINAQAKAVDANTAKFPA